MSPTLSAREEGFETKKKPQLLLHTVSYLWPGHPAHTTSHRSPFTFHTDEDLAMSRSTKVTWKQFRLRDAVNDIDLSLVVMAGHAQKIVTSVASIQCNP